MFEDPDAGGFRVGLVGLGEVFGRAKHVLGKQQRKSGAEILCFISFLKSFDEKDGAALHLVNFA